jgi:hypothetical protein
MTLNEIAGRGARLLGLLGVLLVGFLTVSCSNTMAGGGYGTGSGSGSNNSIPSPPAGGPPYKVTYFNFTVNTYGNPPVDSNSYGPNALVTVLGNVGAPPLTWTGFSFTGWNTMQTMANNLDGGNGGTPYVAGNQFHINSNVYLFGVWQ